MGSYCFPVKRLWDGQGRNWPQAGLDLSLNVAGDLSCYLRWALSPKLVLSIFHFPAHTFIKCAIRLEKGLFL